MPTHHLRHAPLTAALAVCVALVVPAAAQAHYVASSSATCELVGNVPTVTFNVNFKEFLDVDKPVQGTVWIDSTSYAVPSFTWTGEDYTLVWTQATTPGSHTVSGEFSGRPRATTTARGARR
jgi:hypothetical protein